MLVALQLAFGRLSRALCAERLRSVARLGERVAGGLLSEPARLRRDATQSLCFGCRRSSISSSTVFVLLVQYQ